MILFVFEGAEREPDIFQSIEDLFFCTKRAGNRMVCTYNTNIYGLYSHMMRLGDGADIVSCLKSRNTDSQAEIMQYRSQDFAEIFLFFDYDFHHHPSGQSLNIDKNIRMVKEMLSYFDDETDNGKLYINYPMVESLNYTKKLPDTNYVFYSVDVKASRFFKRLTSGFSVFGNYEHLSVRQKGEESAMKIWKRLTIQNVAKANFIEKGKVAMSDRNHPFNNRSLFDSQIHKYGKEGVGVLNSFPLFIYDYFNSNKFVIEKFLIQKYLLVVKIKLLVRKYLTPFTTS